MWFLYGGWELLGDFLSKMTTEGGEGKVCVLCRTDAGKTGRGRAEWA